MSEKKLTRRTLLKGAAAGAIAAPYVITSTALGDADTPPASERLTFGHIGVGNRGHALLLGCMRHKDVESVAVCDVYANRREANAKMIKGKAYVDFRELLARDDIDGVVVATPDHWHVPIAIAAARAKKDAYVEKPLGVCIEQDLACLKAFRENERVFQYGTQQRSYVRCRFGCELVRSGRIGKVHTVEIRNPNGSAGGSTEEIPVPPDLDYNMWCGPAPLAPYSQGRCVPPSTYWIYDYSIGCLGSWGAHPLDIMVWGSDADIAGPIEVEGTGVIPTEGLYSAVYDWDMKVQMADGVKMTYKPGDNSTKFVGPDGWVQIWRGRIDAEPKSLLESTIGPDDVHLTKSTDHARNFIDCMKSRQEVISTLDDALRSNAISLLCDIAVRTGRKITWDPQKEAIVGDEEAAKMASRPMRAPWTL